MVDLMKQYLTGVESGLMSKRFSGVPKPSLEKS